MTREEFGVERQKLVAPYKKDWQSLVAAMGEGEGDKFSRHIMYVYRVVGGCCATHEVTSEQFEECLEHLRSAMGILEKCLHPENNYQI
jgi:hypothetical protein